MANITEPTREQCDAINTVGDALAWVGFAVADIIVPKIAPGSLLAHLGQEPTSNLRDLAVMTQEEVIAEIESWTFNGTRPNFSLRAKAKLAMHAFRITAGVQFRASDTALWEERQHAQKLELARVMQVASPAPPAITESSQAQPGVRSVKLKDIVDGARSDEITAMSPDALDARRARYIRLMHEPPSEEIEPTAEQLSALDHVIKGKCTPYVDFSKWTQFNDRFLRLQQFCGLIFNNEGIMTKRELLGPPNIDVWVTCFMVFATAMIMLGQLLPPIIFRYRDHIIKLVKIFGHECWAIIYQADVRLRQSHLERIRRAESAKLNSYLALDVTAATGFDPDMPWNHCFKLAVQDREFWEDHVRTPCMQIGARMKNVADFLDGDVTVANSSGSFGGVDYNVLDNASRRRLNKERQASRNRANSNRTPPPPKKKQLGNVPSTAAQPEACRLFNSGKCKSDGNGNCPINAARLHVCSKCMQKGHVVRDCPQNNVNKNKGGKGGKGYRKRQRS